MRDANSARGDAIVVVPPACDSGDTGGLGRADEPELAQFAELGDERAGLELLAEAGFRLEQGLPRGVCEGVERDAILDGKRCRLAEESVHVHASSRTITYTSRSEPIG